MSERDDYWMSLARSALKVVLRHDSALYGYGALPIRALDFILDCDEVAALDVELLNSEDEQVRQHWRELLEQLNLSLRAVLLVVVKSILAMLPNRLIPADDIPRVVDSLEFA